MSQRWWAGGSSAAYEDPGPLAVSIDPSPLAHGFTVSLLSSRYLFLCSVPFSNQISVLLSDFDVQHPLGSPLGVEFGGGGGGSSSGSAWEVGGSPSGAGMAGPGIIFRFKPVLLAVLELLGGAASGTERRWQRGERRGPLDAALARASDGY